MNITILNIILTFLLLSVILFKCFILNKRIKKQRKEIDKLEKEIKEELKSINEQWTGVSPFE